MPRKTRMRVTGLAALVVVPLLTGAAYALATTDNMFPTTYAVGPCRTGMYQGFPCQTDNAAVSYYMDSGGENALEAGDKAVVRETLANQYAPTDLSIAYDSTPVFSGSAETDVIFQEGSAGISDDADGTTWCNGTGGDVYDCDQQYIRIRGGGYYTHSLVCHEMGHAVGLQHGKYSQPRLSDTDIRLGCLMTPTGGATTLGDNNRQNINATY